MRAKLVLALMAATSGAAVAQTPEQQRLSNLENTVGQLQQITAALTRELQAHEATFKMLGVPVGRPRITGIEHTCTQSGMGGCAAAICQLAGFQGGGRALTWTVPGPGPNVPYTITSVVCQ